MTLCDKLIDLLEKHVEYMKSSGLYDSTGKHIATMNDWNTPTIQDYMDKMDVKINRLQTLILRKQKLERILNDKTQL